MITTSSLCRQILAIAKNTGYTSGFQVLRRVTLLPVWQWTPVYPGRQPHVYPSIVSTHVASFSHGMDEHSFMSGSLKMDMD